MTALGRCAWRGDKEIAEILIEVKYMIINRILSKAGSKVDQLDGKGITPSMWAIRKGNTDLIKLFVERGADLKIKTP